MSFLFRPIGRKKVGWKRRLVFWGAFVAVLLGGYYWQPIRIEFFPPEAPRLERVTPESAGLFSPGTKVLIVTGHPDDSEFYLGGALLRMSKAGAVLRLVSMTDGDKAYYPCCVEPGLTERRRKEQRRAARLWNGDVVFLGFKDGRLPVNDETVSSLVEQFRLFDPDVVVSIDPVYRPRQSHSDHIDAGRNALRALEEWGEPVTVALCNTRAPNCFIEIEREWFGKVDLLAAHESQFYGDRLDLITGFLADRAIREGKKAGLGMAESLRVYRRE
jgi:LmbE family N-acetylglucosaminyl deacetylase